MERPDTSPAFFERLYRGACDPWDFTFSPYETARYQRMLEALDGRYFESAYEPGCSIGAFTERVAPYCNALLACDASATAVARTRERMSRFPQVEVKQAVLPDDLSPGPFDLIVFSEIGYYFEPPVLHKLVRSLAERLRAGSLMLGCHWLGQSSDHVLHGSTVHALIEDSGFMRAQRRPVSEDGYQLDLWTLKP